MDKNIKDIRKANKKLRQYKGKNPNDKETIKVLLKSVINLELKERTRQEIINSNKEKQVKNSNINGMTSDELLEQEFNKNSEINKRNRKKAKFKRQNDKLKARERLQNLVNEKVLYEQFRKEIVKEIILDIDKNTS